MFAKYYPTLEITPADAFLWRMLARWNEYNYRNNNHSNILSHSEWTALCDYALLCAARHTRMFGGK